MSLLFDDLPDDVIVSIFQHVMLENPKALAYLRGRVCKRWDELFR